MNIYKGFAELEKGLNKPIWEVEEAWEKWLGRNYMLVGEIEVKQHTKDNEFHFIVFDENNNVTDVVIVPES